MISAFFNPALHVRLFERFGLRLVAHEGFKTQVTGTVQRKIFFSDAQKVICHRYFKAACFSCLQSRPGLPSLFHDVNTHRDVRVIQHRYKKNKISKPSVDSDGDDSDASEDEDQDESKDSKVIKGHVNSARMDSVLKFALGMSRNKVDNAFYSNGIYLNGERLDKKKHNVTLEDEVDVVRGQNSLNPLFIDVQRVEVLDIHHSHTHPDKLAIKVRRFKRLTIDNYERPWKPLASE